MNDLIEKIENLDFDDELLTNEELLLNAAGLIMGGTAGPAGLALIAAIRQANNLKNITNTLTDLVKQVCDDPNLNVDNSYFKENLKNKFLISEQKNILEKISKSINLDWSTYLFFRLIF